MEQIQFYRTDVAGRVPSPSNLAEGALAMNLSDKTLYTKDKAGKVIPIGGARDNLQTSVPMGSVVAWGTPAIPYGYLECAGQVVQKADWPEFVELMTGGKTATSYTMPDMRNKFLRGVLSPRLPFSHEAQEIQGHNHNASSSTLPAHSHTRGNMNITGDFAYNLRGTQGWGFGSDTTNGAFTATKTGEQKWSLDASVLMVKNTTTYDAYTRFDASRSWTGNTSQEPAHTPTITVGTAGGAETRPDNIGVKYIMRVATTLGDDGIITTSESLAKSQQAYDLANSMTGKINAINHTDGFTGDGKIRLTVISPRFGDGSNPAQEYLLVCPSNASNPNKQKANIVTGVLKGSRGGAASANNLINLEINVSDAYITTDASFENKTGVAQKLDTIVTLEYGGIRWIALRCALTGGKNSNGMFFEGEIISENATIRGNMFKTITTGYSNVIVRGLVPAPNSVSAWNLPTLPPFFLPADSTTEQVKWRMKDMNTIEIIGIARHSANLSDSTTLFNFPDWVSKRLRGSSYSPLVYSSSEVGVLPGYFAVSVDGAIITLGTASSAGWEMINATVPLLGVLDW